MLLLESMKKVSFLLTIAFVFLISPSILSAQSSSIPNEVTDIKEQISIDVYPQIPKPGEQVTITLAGFSTDLNRATIKWSRNGKQELSEIGAKVFIFTVGPVGSPNNISITITPVSGPVIQRTVSITPGEIDLLWEASTYTPPFYKGKALYTTEAEINFVAIPNMLANGSRVAASDTVYKWKIDRVVQGDKSGYGKNTFSYTGPIIVRPHLIQVEGYAKNDADNIALSGVELEPVSTSAIFYESHPLYGILFNKAVLSSLDMRDNEKEVVVYPYFFSTLNKNNNINYKWNINDSVIPVPTTQNKMRFKKTEQDTGSANVRVEITSPEKILQSSAAAISLFFNNNDRIFLRQ